MGWRGAPYLLGRLLARRTHERTQLRDTDNKDRMCQESGYIGWI